MNKRQIEIFTAGCPVCHPVVEQVKTLASEEHDEVVVYNLIEQCDNGVCLSKVEQYGIKRLPSVAVNGSLLACCNNNEISREEMIHAGIGQNI